MGVLVVQNEAEEAWRYAERFINDGSPNRRSFTDGPDPAVSPRFAPAQVRLPCLHLAAVENSFELGSYDLRDDQGRAILPLHPSIGPYLDREWLRVFVQTQTSISAVPHASGRTFSLVRPGREVGSVKVSFPSRLGRYPAPLDKGKVISALAVNQLLSTISGIRRGSAGGELEIAWFSEMGGAGADILRDPRLQGQAACLLRGRHVETSGEDGVIVDIIPAFSLWGSDFLQDGKEGLALAAIAGEAGSASSLSEAVWTRVVGPLISSVMALGLDYGLLPEPHAQNVLLAKVRREGTPDEWIVVWRDMLGFYVDTAWRREVGCGSLRQGVVKRTLATQHEAVQVRSAMIDHMLYEYLIMPILASARQLGADDLELLRRAREFVSDRATAARDYLPTDGWFHRSLDLPLPGQHLRAVARSGSSMLRTVG